MKKSTVLVDKPATQPPVVVELGEAAASLDSPSHKSGEEEKKSMPEDQSDPKPDESESCSETLVVEIKKQVKGKRRKSRVTKLIKWSHLQRRYVKLNAE